MSQNSGLDVKRGPHRGHQVSLELMTHPKINKNLNPRCLQADDWRILSAADDKMIKVWNLGIKSLVLGGNKNKSYFSMYLYKSGSNNLCGF